MIESHLKEGRQDLKPGVELEYGKGITDVHQTGDNLVALKVLAELCVAGATPSQLVMVFVDAADDPPRWAPSRSFDALPAAPLAWYIGCRRS